MSTETCDQGGAMPEPEGGVRLTREDAETVRAALESNEWVQTIVEEPPEDYICRQCDRDQRQGHDADCIIAAALALLPHPASTYTPDEPYDDPAPEPDEDGHCRRCGLPFEDPAELTHECPPGFLPRPAASEERP